MSKDREFTPEEERERRERLREYARRGGIAKAKKMRAARGEIAPYAQPFLTFLDEVDLGGPTRRVWQMIWRAADALPPDEGDMPLYRLHTGRETWPTVPARECWVCGGRRGEKTGQAVARETHRAISANWHEVLAPGEVGLIVLVAADREQAGNALSRLKGLAKHPVVASHVKRVLKNSVEFWTGATVRIATCSFRTIRGFTLLDAILEECAFYRDESSANPDEELLNAIKPALLTVPGARVYGVSSPYWRKGILWKAYEAHWGRDDSDVLVFNADSLSLNPTLSAATIAREFEEDPARAASEYGAEGLVAFRSDVEAFVAPEGLAAVTVRGRFELPPVPGVTYRAFCDPAGGTGGDSMTLAIAHTEGDVAVLDLVRERRPPFSPAAVVEEFAGTLRAYGLAAVVGDRYAGGWPPEEFLKRGVTYEPSRWTKSELYVAALPALNSGRVQLLDLPRLRAQLVALERRTSRAGKDSVDHPAAGRDDVANAVAGALVLAATAEGGSGRMFFGSVFGPRFELDPEPRPVEWTKHCGREMRCGPREDREGEWLTCIMCGAARSLEPPPVGPDPTREWDEL